MGRLFIPVLIAVSLIFTGCEAFKDYYDTPPAQAIIGDVESPDNEPGGGTPPPPEEPPGEGAPEEEEEAPAEETGGSDEEETGSTEEDQYAVDQTPCAHDPEIIVSYKPFEEAANDGWTEEADSVSAEELGTYTTKFTIASGSDKLTFTIKQVGDADFNVCDVMFEACPDGECVGAKSIWSELKAGVVDVYQFNQGTTETGLTNAGYYNFAFMASNMGDDSVTLIGRYLLDQIGEITFE